MAAYVNAVNMERRPRGLPGAPLLVAGGLAYGDSGKARSATISADQLRSASRTRPSAPRPVRQVRAADVAGRGGGLA